MNSFDYIANVLKQEGVEWLACYPSNALIDAAARRDIRVVSFRHERGAVMAADGYSRISDRKRVGVVAMQSQAGAGLRRQHPHTCSANGQSSGMLFVRPNYSATRSWESVVKRAEFITSQEQTGNVMRRAFHALRSGSPGPVVVEMPQDVCLQPMPDSAQAYVSPKAALTTPSPGDIKDAAQALVAANNPLIWAGAGVLAAGATEELRELAELLDVPVYTTMPGKSAFDERHPLALGAGGMTTTAPARRWILESDVLFAVGSSLTTSSYAQEFPAEKFLIHAVNNPDEINKDTIADVGLVGDARLTLVAMIDAVKGLMGEAGRTTGVQELVAVEQRAWRERCLPYLTTNDAPLSPYRVIWEMDQTLDRENSIVTHDAGAPRDQLVPFYTATSPHSYIGWGKSTHLGFSIPLMIGAKMAMPERMCVNLMGDGAFGMSGMDIETAARASIPITTIILNNGIMATYPRGMGEAEKKFGVSRMQGYYAAIAMGMGAEGIRVEAAVEMAPALKKAQRLNADGKTVLIDVKTRAEHFRGPNIYGDLLGTVGNA